MKKIAFLLDNSGSMASNLPALKTFLSSLNTLLAKKNAGFYGRTFTYNLDSNIHQSPAALSANYYASGGTAIVSSLNKFVESLNQVNGFESTDKVLAICITDGQEESSYNETTAKNICEQVQIQETILRWDWLFVGTDADAVKFSSKVGIKPGKTLQMTENTQGFKAALDSLYNIIDNWADDLIAGDNFFSDEDRKAQTVASTRGSQLI